MSTLLREPSELQERPARRPAPVRCINRQSLAVGLLIAAHAALAVFLAVRLNIWIDEAYTLETTSSGVARAARQALRFELQPPLYFLLLGAWRYLGDSLFVARLFSVACSTLTLVATAGLCRKLWKDVSPAWIVAPLAFNPFLIWAAVEIRVYAFVILLAALLLRLFYESYLATPAARMARIAYVVTALAALYTQYFLGFLLVANAAALAVCGRWRALRTLVASMLLVGLAVSPLFFLASRQVTEHSATVRQFLDWRGTAGVIGWSVRQLLLPLEWTNLESWGSALWLLLAFAAAAGLAWRRGPGSLAAALPLWVLTATGVLAFVLVLKLLGPDLLESRHLASLLVPAMLSGFALAHAAWRRRGVIVWALILLCADGGALLARYSTLAKPGDWQRVAAFIMERERPGQGLAVFVASSALPLSHYYHGQNAIAPIPRAEEFDTYDVRDYALDNPVEVKNVLTPAGDSAREWWLITHGTTPYLVVDFQPEILEDYVARHYAVELDQQISDTRIRLLHPK